MVRLAKWRQWLAMALSVLVMVAVSAGPSLDALLCGGEGGQAVAAESHPVMAAGVLDSIDEGLAPCIHGDCHHVAPFMPLPPSMAAAPFAQREAARRLVRDRVAIGDLQFGLMRPPRA